MSPPMTEQPIPSPPLAYHLLRHALALYGKNLPGLTCDEYRQVLERAERSYQIEQRVLASPKAQPVVIPESVLAEAKAQVAARYPSNAEFEADLEQNYLSPQGLEQALRRELIFDAVMQQVAAESESPITEVDVSLYYEMNRHKFNRPERRSARHILITINDHYPENSRTRARERIEAIAAKLAQKGRQPQQFAKLAERYSECPTAMEGGKLGVVAPGQLYPDIERVLFSLTLGEISGVVESELGFHLLCCDEINAAEQMPLAQVQERIARELQRRQQRLHQKRWLAALESKPESNDRESSL
ncbi:nitrogen fixation protein NifM [Ectothiorhodospiraceae bacterium BW-2]|nr:nitrogen fixation protein NifM [Ectothiorhodospiraceae bacterium BW-2]